ncbi:hypothetical protein K474DRAFT_1723038 [Panus rudis PR-1116 ss-1]|nr:hypothetical protein K474DRAFT_1723038 [Panus rudis PR-1116 ss-1]
MHRDARSLQQGLKELLKTRDILDKDIQVQRINLRRQYLRLLLLYPYAKDSKDAETHLWMQTSYSLISIFKQRISTLDRAIFSPPRHPPQTQSRQEQQQQNQRNFVEYRKLLQRFRQFLADEERFWGQLLLRLYRNFAIDAAEPALTALGLLPEDEPPIADGAPSRRNQFQFPPESDSVIEELLPTTTAQRESRLTTFSKALVCLGDLARYKEQYNEAGGRPRAGHEEGPPANPPTKSRGKKGPPNHIQLLPRMRNYDRAKLCYDQARLLTPHDGNPSHQLAIICSYQKEIYNSLYHYYRALCVRQPYDTAAENMGNVLHRALEQWKARGGKPKEIEIDVDGHPHQADQIQSFMERIIVLHAMWRFGGNDVDNLNQETLADFAQMLQEKVIPEEIINKAVILSQSALWKHRMIRHSSHNEKRVSRSPVVEARMATHLLGMHRAMLELSLQELNEELPKDVPKGDLAQSITAKLRRMIPALRMAGKWIRANTRYLSQARDARDPPPPEGTNASPQKSRRRTGRENQKDKNTQIVITGLRKFWDVSVRFANALNDKFPVDKLPAANQPLEEDIEMTGFLPLRKYMFGEARIKDAQGEAKAAEGEAGRQQHVMTRPDKVHPNEEQLMRISDILSDLKGIAEDEVRIAVS